MTFLETSPHLHRNGWIRALVPTAIFIAGVAGLVGLSAIPKKVSDKKPEDLGPPKVETVQASSVSEGVTIEVDGVVVPYREITVAAEVGGRIVKKDPVANEGNFVPKDKLLLEIDPRDYDIELRRLRKELDQADTQIKELDVEAADTQTMIDLAEQDQALQQKEVQRQLRLAEQNFSSEAVLDQARQAVLAARNAVMKLRSQLNLLNTRRSRLESARDLMTVRMEKAEIDLGRTKIVSPVDGVIVSDEVEQDSYVTPGTPLVMIEDTSKAEVKCNLRSDQLYWIWRQKEPQRFGSTATVAPESLYEIPPTDATVVFTIDEQEYEWKGRLARYEGIGLDQATRTIPVRVLVDNPQSVRIRSDGGNSSGITPPALLRGMFVKVRIHAKPRASLIRVPEISIRPGDRVWRVRDGKLKIIEIREITTDHGFTTLEGTDELVAGDHVVTSPLAGVSDAMEVTLVQDAPASSQRSEAASPGQPATGQEQASRQAERKNQP